MSINASNLKRHPLHDDCVLTTGVSAGRDTCCTICMEEISSTCQVTTHCKCNNSFHSACFDEWVASATITDPIDPAGANSTLKSATCPNCRGEVKGHPKQGCELPVSIHAERERRLLEAVRRAAPDVQFNEEGREMEVPWSEDPLRPFLHYPHYQLRAFADHLEHRLQSESFTRVGNFYRASNAEDQETLEDIATHIEFARNEFALRAAQTLSDNPARPFQDFTLEMLWRDFKDMRHKHEFFHHELEATGFLNESDEVIFTASGEYMRAIGTELCQRQYDEMRASGNPDRPLEGVLSEELERCYKRVYRLVIRLDPQHSAGTLSANDEVTRRHAHELLDKMDAEIDAELYLRDAEAVDAGDEPD